MCILKYFYYYFWVRSSDLMMKKEVDIEWQIFEKKNGICKICNKHFDRIISKNDLCYRCFENWFYENK